jgi:hypothetical protein
MVAARQWTATAYAVNDIFLFGSLYLVIFFAIGCDFDPGANDGFWNFNMP